MGLLQDLQHAVQDFFYRIGLSGDFPPGKSYGYHMRVMTTQTRQSKDGPYTVYLISLRATNPAFRLKQSRAWRRYSDFEWLRKQLNQTDHWTKPPRLPGKKIFNVMDPAFVEERRVKLEQWLNEVLSQPMYLSCTAFHLFLQTELSIESIQDFLDSGNYMCEERVNEVWKNQGKLFHYQPHNLLHNSYSQEPMEIHCSLRDRPSPTNLPPPQESEEQDEEQTQQQQQQQQEHQQQQRRSPRSVQFSVQAEVEVEKKNKRKDEEVVVVVEREDEEEEDEDEEDDMVVGVGPLSIQA